MHFQTLTMQLPSLHMHGAVLGPWHIVRTAFLVISLHRQLAMELHIIISFIAKYS